MKKSVCLIILAFTVFIGSLNAQEAAKTKPRKTAEQRTEMVVKRLTEKLTLTADQQQSIHDIVLKREKLRDAGTLKKEDRQKFVGDINNILSKDQQDKYLEYRKEMASKHQEQKGKKGSHDDDATDDAY